MRTERTVVLGFLRKQRYFPKNHVYFVYVVDKVLCLSPFKIFWCKFFPILFHCLFCLGIILLGKVWPTTASGLKVSLQYEQRQPMGSCHLGLNIMQVHVFLCSFVCLLNQLWCLFLLTDFPTVTCGLKIHNLVPPYPHSNLLGLFSETLTTNSWLESIPT